MLKSKRALRRSRSIDEKIEQERERRTREIQLLVLGGASSGKSTFIKQLRLYHGDEFSDTERKQLVVLIYENLTDALNILVENMDRRGVDFGDPSNRIFARQLRQDFPRWRNYQYITAPGERVCLPDYMKIREYLGNIEALAKDDGVQRCQQDVQHDDIVLKHAEEYFVRNVERLSQPDYLPSIQDILYIRKPTLGVQEHVFNLDNLYYRVIDVAGQKNQRKKWIHLFEGVTAVLFFAALSGFCETLEEDSSLNSLQDSLTTFVEVTRNCFLEKADLILFLNKKDVLTEYLRTKQLSTYFPVYTGSNTPEQCIQFIKEAFFTQKPPNKDIYCHVTCAVDREFMKGVIDDVMHIIVEINLRLVGSPL